MSLFLRVLILFAAASPLLPVGAAEVVLNRALNERIEFIRPGAGIAYETTIFKPDGDGPFPLAVINHGKEPGDSRFQARARFIVASRELVRRGYVVALPMRGGFSKSSGTYLDGGCNIESNGRYYARHVRDVLDWLVKQPYVDRSRIVIIGQSHGGLTAMAFAAEPYEGVRGILNFAGGLRLSGERCFSWEKSLVDAFRTYGGSARMPSLWFYGENDSYFGPELARRMHEAYAAGGGKAKLIAFGPFKGDAHNTFGDRDGLKVWWPEAEMFLTSIGMPTAILPRPPSDDPALALLADTSRVPNLGPNCTGIYNLFLDADYPRAFAISTDRHCGYAYGGEDPKKRALDTCQRRATETCKLYAVDTTVVWE